MQLAVADGSHEPFGIRDLFLSIVKGLLVPRVYGGSENMNAVIVRLPILPRVALQPKLLANDLLEGLDGVLLYVALDRVVAERLVVIRHRVVNQRVPADIRNRRGDFGVARVIGGMHHFVNGITKDDTEWVRDVRDELGAGDLDPVRLGIGEEVDRDTIRGERLSQLGLDGR